MKLITLSILLTLITSLMPAHSIAGAITEFSSGNNKVRLIELYSSQGCSSCPPAEKWLNNLKTDKRLWKEIVPLGFHVDYWDRLGWKDPFGSQEFTERQHEHKRKKNIGSVYTPGFVVDGSEWRGWFRGSNIPDTKEKAGVLSAKIADGKLKAEYSDKNAKLELNYAVLGFGLSTNVTRGENSGKTLSYDFIVLSHKKTVSENGVWNVNLPEKSSIADAKKYAIALWLNKPGSLDPVQAAGSWLKTTSLETVE